MFGFLLLYTSRCVVCNMSISASGVLTYVISFFPIFAWVHPKHIYLIKKKTTIKNEYAILRFLRWETWDLFCSSEVVYI